MEQLHDPDDLASARTIPLTQGLLAIVDEEDHEELAQFRWRAARRGRSVYAIRHLPRKDGAAKGELMHRVVLARKLGRPLLRSEEVDHENGDGLDNRRGKLRLATHGQNQRNRCRRMPNTSSRFLGVSLDKRHNTWDAAIKVDRKAINLGSYSTELDAALAREEYIAAHPELMARSNFPRRR